MGGGFRKSKTFLLHNPLTFQQRAGIHFHFHPPLGVLIPCKFRGMGRDGCRKSGERKLNFPSLALQISSSTLPFPRTRIWKGCFFEKNMEDGKIGQKGGGGFGRSQQEFWAWEYFWKCQKNGAITWAPFFSAITRAPFFSAITQEPNKKIFFRF